jgi:hypothetical protein
MARPRVARRRGGAWHGGRDREEPGTAARQSRGKKKPRISPGLEVKRDQDFAGAGGITGGFTRELSEARR